MAKRQAVRKTPVHQEENMPQPQVSSFKLPKLSIDQFKKFKPQSYGPLLVVLLLVSAFLIGVLLTKVYYLEKGVSTANPTPIDSAAQGNAQTAPVAGAKVDVDPGKLEMIGNKDAKVTIIEFADFQCPFCKQWFTDVGKNLIKDYVDTGKAKFAFRNFAFLGEESNWSSEAAYCANDQGKFWQYHDYLYEHQGAENSGAFSKDNLKGFAATLGLNTADFNSCLDSGKYTKAVQDDTAAGGTAGVTGTPTVFVNGVPLVGAQPYAALKTQIDQELSK